MNILYETGKKYLGKDISKTQTIYGCAEAVNFICKEATGEEVGGGLSTTKMYEALLKNKKFEKIDIPEIGSIIISPTGFGVGNGHTGIVSDNNKIMSANSITDKWDEHLDLQTWQTRYASFPILFFRYIMDETKDIELEQKKINILKRIVALYKQIISLLKK